MTLEPPSEWMRGPTTMRGMTEAEIDGFVARQSFGVLALAEGGRALGVPLFYGNRGGDLYFQTRGGDKSHYLFATAEACLTVAVSGRGEDFASVQLFGRLERVDATGPAAEALKNAPPPLPLEAEDRRVGDRDGEVTTFRLAPSRRVGRYSERAKETALEREEGYGGM